MTIEQAVREHALAHIFPDLKGLFSRPSPAYLPDTGAEVAAGVPRYIAVDGDTGILVERGTTNLLTANQADVETDLTGLERYNPTNCVLTRDTTTAWHGSASAKVETTGSIAWAGLGLSSTYYVSVTAGTIYTISLYGKISAASERQVKIYTQWFKADRTFITAIDSPLVNGSNIWTRYTLTATAPAEAAYLRIVFVMYNAIAGEAIWWDGAQVEAHPYATSWHLGGAIRTDEFLSVPRPAGLTPSAGTVEFDVYITSAVKRRVAGELPHLIRIPGTMGSGEIALYHSDSATQFVLSAKDDSGTATTATIADSAIPDGMHRFRLAWGGGSIRLYMDANTTPLASISSPLMPSGLGANIEFLGSGANCANMSAHGLGVWNIDRATEGLSGPGMEMIVNEYTLGVWNFNGNLDCLARTGLAALIGDRLYYGALPNPVTLPAVTYFLVSNVRDHVTDKRAPRFQFTAWAADYQTAASVAAQIEDAFIRYKGFMAGEVPVIQGVIIVSGYDLPPETVPDGTRYGRAVDVQIHYR